MTDAELRLHIKKDHDWHVPAYFDRNAMDSTHGLMHNPASAMYGDDGGPDHTHGPDGEVIARVDRDD